MGGALFGAISARLEHPSVRPYAPGCLHPRLRPGPARPGIATTGARIPEILHGLIARIGARGLLRMSVKRAVEYVHAAAVGYVLSEIRVMHEERDSQLSAVMREDAIFAIWPKALRSTPLRVCPDAP